MYLAYEGIFKINSIDDSKTPNPLLRRQFYALQIRGAMIANSGFVTGVHEVNDNTQTQNFEPPVKSPEDGDGEVVSANLISHSDDDSSQNCVG
ncbi:hypothetical protein TSMEX_006562 [Taenia solium]|eukprot:TsM_000814100 transcript=TsM_000814100 gene=TsM_000814100